MCSESSNEDARREIHDGLREHDGQSRAFAGAARDGVDDCEEGRIARHAEIDGSGHAVDVHGQLAELEPIGGELVVENGVSGGGGEFENEKQT